MKRNYILTLYQSKYRLSANQILLPNDGIEMIIKGINALIEQEHNHYELYAKEIKIYPNIGDGISGSYKDGTTWVDMEWDVTEIKSLD